MGGEAKSSGAGARRDLGLYRLDSGDDYGGPVAPSILRKTSPEDAVIVFQSFSKSYRMVRKATQLKEFIVSHAASMTQKAAEAALAQGEAGVAALGARPRGERGLPPRASRGRVDAGRGLALQPLRLRVVQGELARELRQIDPFGARDPLVGAHDGEGECIEIRPGLRVRDPGDDLAERRHAVELPCDQRFGSRRPGVFEDRITLLVGEMPVGASGRDRQPDQAQKLRGNSSALGGDGRMRRARELRA